MLSPISNPHQQQLGKGPVPRALANTRRYRSFLSLLIWFVKMMSCFHLHLWYTSEHLLIGLLAFFCELPFHVLLNISKRIFKSWCMYHEKTIPSPTKIWSRGFIPTTYQMLFGRRFTLQGWKCFETRQGWWLHRIVT